MNSDWVLEEAEEGRRRKILVPILIEDVAPPLGFRRIQAAALFDFDTTETSGQLDKLVADITDILGPPTGTHQLPDSRKGDDKRSAEGRYKPSSVVQQTESRPGRWRRILVSVGLTVILLLMVVAGYFIRQNIISSTASSTPQHPKMNRVVATVLVEKQPFSIAFSPDGTRAYVTNARSNTVSAIDAIQNKVIKNIQVEKDPHNMAITPDGKRLYVVNISASTVSVIDTASDSVVANIPVGQKSLGVAITPNGWSVYVASGGSNSITIIDTEHNTISRTISTEAPRDLAMSPNKKLAYVTSYRDNVTIIDTVLNKVKAIIPVGANPEGIALSPDGTRAYVANSGSDSVSVVDTVSNKVIANVAVGDSPRYVAVTPDGERVYVTNTSSGTVSVIEAGSNTVIATIPVGIQPIGLAIRPDGTQIYVANNGSDSVSIID